MIQKVLFIDSTHPVLPEMLRSHGFDVDYIPELMKEDYLPFLHQYSGIIIRSKFKLDKDFLEKATQLKFIARQGAGMENIDLDYAASRGIVCLNSPEGNRDALGEHTVGMLLSLFNHLNRADRQVRQGIWDREGNRGLEIKGKTIAIIGYGNMGSAFAQRLKGFECRILAYDKYKKGFGNEWVEEVSMEEVFAHSDVLSLHVPLTEETTYLLDREYINSFKKNFYLLNTARGKNVKTDDLVEALQSGKILGAGLDVLEYEDTSFEALTSIRPSSFDSAQDDGISPSPPLPLSPSPVTTAAEPVEAHTSLLFLLASDNVLLTPHIAGFSVESKVKLAQYLGEKIIQAFGQ